MELRIPINNRRKQFAGIGRDYLCDFQNGVQYQFPYPVRNGELESIASNITEEGSDGLIGLKPLYRTEDIVLHHRQREAGNLCREVYALASAEVEQLLAVVICHLGSPSHGVGAIGLEEAEREVCGELSVPLSLSASLREEQAHGGSSKLHVDGAVGALERPVVLGESLFLELCDNLVGRQLAPLGAVLGLAHLDHAKQMTLDVAAGNQANEICTGKPTVNEQIVEADATFDGVLHHLDGLVGLLHRVFLDALLNTLPRIVCGEPFAALFVRQPLLPVGITAFFAMKREVEEQLAHAVSKQQRQALVSKDALMLDMGEHLADKLTLTTTLRSVRIINNQADRLVMLSLCAAINLPQQLKVHRIEQLAPLDITIIHKTIEHVLLTTEQAA